jgi:hypothetical protein
MEIEMKIENWESKNRNEARKARNREMKIEKKIENWKPKESKNRKRESKGASLFLPSWGGFRSGQG